MHMSDSQTKHENKVPDTQEGQFLTSFQRKLLRKNLQEENLPQSYRQRLEIMLLADEGKSQSEICQTLGCCPATARHWMHIARTGMAHQWQECPIGRPKAVNQAYLQRLQELVSNSPRDYGYVFRRWTANWLKKHLAKEFGVEVSDRHLKRLLKQMGLSTIPKTNHTSEKAKGSKIQINDLKTEPIADNCGFLPLNFAELGKDSDRHGAKSVRSVSFAATTGQYFGISCFGTGISALSSSS
jgi:transposase